MDTSSADSLCVRVFPAVSRSNLFKSNIYYIVKYIAVKCATIPCLLPVNEAWGTSASYATFIVVLCSFGLGYSFVIFKIVGL